MMYTYTTTTVTLVDAVGSGFCVSPNKRLARVDAEVVTNVAKNAGIKPNTNNSIMTHLLHLRETNTKMKKKMVNYPIRLYTVAHIIIPWIFWHFSSMVLFRKNFHVFAKLVT